MTQMNPLANYVRLESVTSTEFKLVLLSDVDFHKVTTSGDTAQGGTLSSSTVPIESFHCRVSGPLSTHEDIPTLRARIVEEVIAKYGGELAQRCYKTMADAALSNDITSGSANALPADTELVGKFADLMAAVSSQYHITGNCAFLTSLPIYRKLVLSSSSAGEYITRPADRSGAMFTLFGFPVFHSSNFVDAEIDGTVLGAFANWRSFMTLGMRRDLTIEESSQERLGEMRYLGRTRFRYVATDTAAAARLVVGA